MDRLVLFSSAIAGVHSFGGSPPAAPVTLQFLAVSDFHGQLQPLNIFGEGDFGGVATLRTYFQAEKANNPGDTWITVAAGDTEGATPPIAALFDDKNVIEALNMLEFDADTVGNHNFDGKLAHLQELRDLAKFPFVCANCEVPDGAAMKPFAPYTIVERSGVKVALIGLANEDVIKISGKGVTEGTIFTDQVEAANKARAQAKQEGAQVFVILIHEGLDGFDAEGNPEGRLIDFANKLTPGHFDYIQGDHKNSEWAGIINGAMVVENFQKGRSYSVVSLTYDPNTSTVTDKQTRFVSADITKVVPDADVEKWLQTYVAEMAKIGDDKIGEIGYRAPRRGALEPWVGMHLTQAMRWKYDTQLAMMNDGGLRTGLPSTYIPTDPKISRAQAPFDLVKGDILAIQPFNNAIFTSTITGAALKNAIEFSYKNANPFTDYWAGVFVTYCKSRSPVVSSIRVGDAAGPEVKDGDTFTFATNEFIAQGGEGFSFGEPTWVSQGPDTVASFEYFVDHPIVPTTGSLWHVESCL